MGGGAGRDVEGGAEWITHAWLKEAVLLFFALQKMSVMEVGPFEYHDKIPTKRGLEAACAHSRILRRNA